MTATGFGRHGRLEQAPASASIRPISASWCLPKNREEMKAILREEIAYDGFRSSSPPRVHQTAKRHNNAAKQKQ